MENIRGDFEIQVSDDGLSAKVIFREGKDQWNSEELTLFLKDRGIKNGLKADVINSIFEKEGIEPGEEFEIAEGNAPELPASAYVDWQDLYLPEKYRSLPAKLFTSQPEVFLRETKQVVEKEEPEKKGFFGLGGKKSVEKKVKKVFLIKQKVELSYPEFAFVNKGDRVAQVQAAKSAKPGLTVTGSRIEPEEQEEVPKFAYGKLLEKRKDGLYALDRGVMRYENLWAELVPFFAPYWKINLSDDGTECTVSFFPGKTRPVLVPSANEILERAKQLSGFGSEDFIGIEKLQNMLQKATDADKKFENYNILVKKSAETRIEITPDNLSATLFVHKPHGEAAKDFDMKSVGRMILAKGIEGLDLDKIQKDLQAFQKSNAPKLENYLLIQKDPPPKGKDKILEFKNDFMSEEDLQEVRIAISSSTNEKDLETAYSEPVSLKRIQDAFMVKKSELIARIVASEEDVESSEYSDIFGNPLLPLPGNDPNLSLLDHVQLNGSEIQAETAGLLMHIEEEGVHKMRILPYQDAYVEISLTEDNMKAHLTIHPELGLGAALEEDALKAAIAEKGIVKGVIERLINESYEKYKHKEPVKDLMIAEGLYPISGKCNISFSEAFSKLNEVDWSSHDKPVVLPIKKGQEIGITRGKAAGGGGWTILGDELSEDEENELFELSIGANIEEEEADNLVRLVAKSAGELQIQDGEITINDRRILAGGARASEEPVQFIGSIEVSGDVADGAKLVAGGNIYISGQVEAGVISAEGGIAFRQGIKGKGKAILRAKEEIRGVFSERATLMTVTNVRLTGSCFQSIVKVNGKLILEGEKGFLVGGNVRARQGIEVQNVGSEKGIETQVSFGQDYLIYDHIELELREIEKLKQYQIKLDNMMTQDEVRKNPKKLQLVRHEKLKTIKMNEKRSLRLFNYREKFEEHYEGQILIRGIVYPGTILESHGRTLEIKEQKKQVLFYFDLETGHIKEKPLG
jgi:uncharacterized protein (DUF342 family)